jgi:hypothetical protein
MVRGARDSGKEGVMRLAAVLAVVVLTASVAIAAPRLATPGSLSNSGGSSSWEAAKEVVVKWTQLPEVGGIGITSEQCIGLGIVSESAEDFYCEDGAPIVAVEWWGVDWTDEVIDFFIIRFYSDVPGPPYSHPGDLLYEEECHAFTYELIPGQFDQYYYYVDLPSAFDQDGDTIYWISIQAVHPTDQWFWLECEDAYYWNDAGVVRSEFFGFPDWVTVEGATGTYREFSFVLYADVMSPVESTTWGGVKAMFR